MNIGNPSEITIREFAEEIISLIDTKSKIINKDLPKDDPKQRCPDITKAKDILRWEPQVPRSEGLRKTLAYFQNKVC